MKLVIQRVSDASVKVDGKLEGSIDQGFMILCAVTHEDDESDIKWLVNKVKNMRIFSDDEGKMNLSIMDVQGAFLVISQFTLYASTKKGNRPSFLQSARADKANGYYERFVDILRLETGLKVETGVFGGDMKVSLLNDGPVTIIIDSQNRV